MAIFNKYPYTSFQEMNLDWILQELKDLTDQWEAFEHQYEGITASASTVPYGAGASVIVTGGAGVPFNFDFQIPAGKDLKLVSTVVKYGTSADTNTQPLTWYNNIPVVPQGEYLWTRTILTFNDGSQSTFYSVARSGLDGLGSVVTVNNISPDGNGNVSVPIPVPSNNTPLMDTPLGSEGVSADYSRADHQHISDTTKLDIQTGLAIGDINAYVVKDVANQTIVPVSASAGNSSIAMYTATGSLVVNEPQTVYEAPRLLDVQNGFVSTTDITNYVAKTDIATASTLGIVQPDGVSITVDSDGILSAVAGGMVMDVLWTNTAYPSTTTFNAQTITIDLSSYKMIGIEYINATDVVVSDRRFLHQLFPKEDHPYHLYGELGGKLTSRSINSLTDSGIEFTTGYWYATYGGSAISPYCCVPYRIFGIK